MHLHTSKIPELLSESLGRHIEHHRGVYVMKEANGANVVVHENGESVHIHPLESQIEDLVAAGHLVRDGNLYRLP